MADIDSTIRDAIDGYLKQPYARLLVPEPDGTYRGEILEFPGCLATGDKKEETLANLEEAAADWLAAALERGQTIPEPAEANEYSGRLVLRIPRSLHKKAALLAEKDGGSLNQFIVTSLACYVGERSHAQGIVYSGVFSGSGNFLFNTTTVASGLALTNSAGTFHTLNPDTFATGVVVQHNLAFKAVNHA